VHNLRGGGVDHVDPQLALHNAGQEALVNQLPLVALNVLLAEGHEVVHSLLLLVVVKRFLQVQHCGAGDAASVGLVLQLAHPDALALGAAVLLEHACATGNGLGEALLEAGDVVVGVGVRHAAR